MRLAVEQLKLAIQIATRKITDSTAARDSAQRQVDEHVAQIAMQQAIVHECNAAMERMQRAMIEDEATAKKVAAEVKVAEETTKNEKKKR